MNDAPRFHVDARLSAGLCLELSLAEAHHAMHVLRLRTGDTLELFTGSGESAAASIVQAKHGKVLCEVTDVHPAQPRPTPRVHLAFAVPKGKRLDWLLEKATELAAASLTPVAFERSVAGGEELSDNKRERWVGHCIAAAKQSGLNFLPEVREMATLPSLLQASSAPAAAGALRRLVGDLTDRTVTLSQALSPFPTAELMVIVGPEGGLTEGERQLLADAGVTPVRLGQTVLRIETAAVALLAAVTALSR